MRTLICAKCGGKRFWSNRKGIVPRHKKRRTECPDCWGLGVVWDTDEARRARGWVVDSDVVEDPPTPTQSQPEQCPAPIHAEPALID